MYLAHDRVSQMLDLDESIALGARVFAVGVDRRLIHGQVLTMSLHSAFIAALPMDEMVAAVDIKTAIPLLPTSKLNPAFDIVWAHINGSDSAKVLNTATITELLAMWEYTSALAIPLDSDFFRLWVSYTTQAIMQAQNIDVTPVCCQFRDMLLLLPKSHNTAAALRYITQTLKPPGGYSEFLAGPPPTFEVEHRYVSINETIKHPHISLDDTTILWLQVVDLATRITFMLHKGFKIHTTHIKCLVRGGVLCDSEYDEQHIITVGNLTITWEHGWWSSSTHSGKRLWLGVWYEWPKPAPPSVYISGHRYAHIMPDMSMLGRDMPRLPLPT